MKKSIFYKYLLIGFFTVISLIAFAKQEKVLQIFRNGEVIQEYAVDDIDYIEINDMIQAPENVSASVADNQITISWNAVEGAVYNIYRSPDNVNFSLLVSGVKETTYTDTKPLNGANYYRVKSVVGDVESGYTASVAATLTNSGLGNGVYLGISSFNQNIYDYPILQLNESTVDGFRGFVDGLTMKNGTLLYYSVDQALNTMKATELPSDLSTAAIVTFTDGLDQGSMMKDVPYDDDMAYLEALNSRIKNETVSGVPITAFSIGIRGKDVGDINMFRNNLSLLASSPENATEVTSMAEVNAKFKEIAEELSKSNYVQTINLKMPGVSNGTIVRFTFDNVNSAENSNLYIEGKFNLKERSLEDVKYVGLSSTSGTVIKGKVDGIFVNFTFERVHTDNNVLIKNEFTDEWTYITSNSSWQINSEFDKTENSDIVTERSSAVIMLVLDCSSSLADDFANAQSNANDFINTLYQTIGGTEEPGNNEETIYPTKPMDLSVAIWKEGQRYFLTPEQYKNANLANVTVEGLTVLSAMGNFIISPELIQNGNVNLPYATEYYSDVLPDKDQATVISARYIDINNTLSSLGWESFSTYRSTYLTKTSYDDSKQYNYGIDLQYYTGGEITYTTTGLIRGVKEINTAEPIIWKDSRDLKLSVLKNGERYFIDNPGEDLSQYDEIEGISVCIGKQHFIIKLQDEQSGKINVTTAMSLYSDILPNKTQASIISMKYLDINDALTRFGGSGFSTYQSTYLTKTPNESDNRFNYAIQLQYYYGGEITYTSSGLIRGVKTLSE